MIYWVASLALLGVCSLFFIRGLRQSRALQAAYRRGAACYQFGRLEEAELALRRSLSGEKRRKLRTAACNLLGKVLMEQGRWKEAADCFRESIGEAPHSSGGHRALAELLLRQGQQPDAALDAARRAVVNDRASKPVDSLSLSQSLALYAWALSRSAANRSDIDAALNEAFDRCGESSKPTRSALHYYAAYTHANLHNISESRRHFEIAAQIDPQRNYGRLAASASGITAEAERHREMH